MQSDVVNLGGLAIQYLVDGAAHGRKGMFELTVQPNASVPPAHSHSDNDEIVYVLDGTLRYSVDDETRDLHAGDWMASPRGSVHAFSNPFDATARPHHVVARYRPTVLCRRLLRPGIGWTA